MTNAEKYLKEGTDTKKFAEMIDTAYVKADKYADVYESTINWLNKQVQPTLAEDERIILRNMKLYVGRRMNGELFFTFENRKEPFIKGELFQFIKERRRIFY